MKSCPYCGYSNYDAATVCRKCEGSFIATAPTVRRTEEHWIGPIRARQWRQRALSMLVIGLLMKVYWGGYGPWPVIDSPTLAALRTWLEPILLVGGVLLYIVGFAAQFV